MFEHRNKLAVPDSTKYFMESMDRIGKMDYVPNNDDIILVRYRTAGMTEKVFQINGTPFRIVDVGGQRSERKKWIHFFDGQYPIQHYVSMCLY